MALSASPTATQILRELGAIRDSFQDSFGIEIVGLAGSRARGDHEVTSDVDVAVKLSRRIGLGGIVDATDWLESRLGLEVDLVFFEALPDYKKSLFTRDLRELA
jgi:predicted nucleotidyltransferase